MTRAVRTLSSKIRNYESNTIFDCDCLLVVGYLIWKVAIAKLFPNRYQLRMYARTYVSRSSDPAPRGRSEATQRRRIADERWVVASRGEGEVKVVRLGKPDFGGFSSENLSNGKSTAVRCV